MVFLWWTNKAWENEEFNNKKDNKKNDNNTLKNNSYEHIFKIVSESKSLNNIKKNDVNVKTINIGL